MTDNWNYFIIIFLETQRSNFNAEKNYLFLVSPSNIIPTFKTVVSGITFIQYPHQINRRKVQNKQNTVIILFMSYCIWFKDCCSYSVPRIM